VAPAANGDDDGNRRRYATLALDAAVAPGHELGLDARVVRGNAQYDNPGAFGAPTDTQEQYLLQRAVSLRGRHALGSDWHLAWRAGDANEIRRDTWVTGFGGFSFGNTLHNRALALEATGAVAPGWTAQLGAEQVRQSTDNATYLRKSRRTDVLRAGVQHDAEWGGVQANVRRDRTSDFGSATTGLLGGRWQVTRELSAIGSVSTSFTPPTLDFLFFDCAPFPACSNPDLRPEKSRNAELGAQWQRDSTLLRATLFHVRHRDKIVNVFDAASGSFIPTNVGRARNRGVELAARTALGPWRLAGEAVFQKPIDVDTGEVLQRRPRRQFALRGEHDAGAWSAGAALRHVGHRPDVQPDTFAATTLPSYTVVDLNARWRVATQWTLQATLENVFDRAYQPTAGYNGRPRGAFVSLAWQSN
jgi:vitamin B12 transporter